MGSLPDRQAMTMSGHAISRGVQPVLMPPTLDGERGAECSLATSSDARHQGDRYRVDGTTATADVHTMEPGLAPRKHAPPRAVVPPCLTGVWRAIARPGQFRAGFSEQRAPVRESGVGKSGSCSP